MERKQSLKDVIKDFVESKRLKNEEEKAITLFALLDENGEVVNYKELEAHDVMEESVLGLVEDDLLFEENEIDVEIEEKIKEIADDIKPLNTDLMFEVNGGEKLLVDKVNCNIKEVPILNCHFISNKDVIVVSVKMDDTTKNLGDVELIVLFKYKDGQCIMSAISFETLYQAGLIMVLDAHEQFDLELNNLEFRALTSSMDNEELGKLVDLSNLVELNDDLDDVEVF